MQPYILTTVPPSEQHSQTLTGSKLIKIQTLPLKQQQKPNPTKHSKQNLLQVLNQNTDYQNKQDIYYCDTGKSQYRIIVKDQGTFHQCNFFNTFLTAYLRHGDLYLTPDQIWIMIMFYISKYIDQNAQKIRPKIVHHQGVKTLNVQICSQTRSLNKIWPQFFQQILSQVQKQTLSGVIQDFQCNFTTTTQTHKIISTCLIMNSCKKYFKYDFSFGVLCGIQNIYMTGIREDWLKMSNKLSNIVQLDVDGKLKQYIEHMQIILKKLVDTYDGNPDINWWNSVIQQHGQYGGICGTPIIKQISGWILHFYGIYQKSQIMTLPQMKIQVPVQFIDKQANRIKNMTLVSDWVSTSCIQGRVYKPDVGLAIFQIGEQVIEK